MFDGIKCQSVFFVTQESSSHLNDGGRIINLSSFVTCSASPNVFTYSISKGAIDTFTFLFATQLGPCNIRVNAVLIPK
ncbi:SDR family oxidoreductase [Enterococcus caccae]|uniref:SDR family oxidoreductase n=1 Tax=Enterococcus caccae TaxID=317735 RepID=UPI00090028B9